jgi:hypothetical protein
MTKYGIEITRPWSKEMYDHNDMVGELMKSQITNSIKSNKNNWDVLNELMTLCGGVKYGIGFSIDDLYKDCLTEVETVQNYWLHQEYPYAVSKGYVNDVDIEFIGYDK